MCFYGGLADGLEVGVYHELNELLEGEGGLPAELLFCLGRIADEEIDFGGAEVALIEVDVVLPAQVYVAEGDLEEFFDGVGFTCGDDVVFWLFLLEHEPHGFDIVFGVAPVAFGV